MRLVVLSDTHGLHDRIESLPEGDILVHAGDFMNSGYEVETVVSVEQFLKGVEERPRSSRSTTKAGTRPPSTRSGIYRYPRLTRIFNSWKTPVNDICLSPKENPRSERQRKIYQEDLTRHSVSVPRRTRAIANSGHCKPPQPKKHIDGL
jgi:hypothetical protein